MLTASLLTDLWNDQLVEHQRESLFLVLVGFVVSFGFIRLSTRLMRSPRVPWWPGSVVSDSGVHLHHLVFGIGLMMAAGTLGFAGFASSPWHEICAFVFGIGIGLTIDEFALWVHLDDVYWAKEGRASVDAAVIAVAIIGLVLVGVRPFEVVTDSPEAVAVSALISTLVLAAVLICLAKGRPMHALTGFLVFPLAVYGAARIGKPGSAWARRLYGGRNPAKQGKAERRFHPDRRTDRFKERFRDAVGGVTAEEYEARRAAEARGALDAAAEVQARAESVTEEEEERRG
jgi:hypothetical protein